MKKEMQLDPRIRTWRKLLVISVSGLVVFETATGLFVFLLSAGTLDKLVWVHSGIGVAFLSPLLIYQIRHSRMHTSDALTPVKLTGYASLIATPLAIISGITLAYQAFFLSEISFVWDVLHFVSVFMLIGAALPHLALVTSRARGK